MRNEYLACVTLIDHAAETLRLEAEAEWSWAPPDWEPEAALTATALCEIELTGGYGRIRLELAGEEPNSSG